jgi:hypothetical protein
MSLSPRQRRRAEERAATGYPTMMAGRVVVVPDNEWMNQFDAASALGVSVLRIGSLIANEHLVAAENTGGTAGVTRASVELEQSWRSSSTKLARTLRFLGDLLRWL